MADLTIYVDVVQLPNGEWQTVSSYSIPPSGKVIFENLAQNHGELKITPKIAGTELPFCKSDGTTKKTLPPIVYGTPAGAKICNDYDGKDFLYTAQIGSANAEDPIVIIEKSKLNYWDPAVAAVAGALIGAGIAYLIVKSRGTKMRPQQG